MNCKAYEQKIESDKEASSVNNMAEAETAVGSSVDSGEEAPEKVCIDSDSDDEDDESINNNSISSIQQLKAADEEAGKIEFKAVSKKWSLYGKSLTDDKWRMLYPKLQKECKLDMVAD